MCKYCENNNKVEFLTPDEKGTPILGIEDLNGLLNSENFEDWTLVVADKDNVNHVHINFCPMCGRQLNSRYVEDVKKKENE